ncbi:MAG TPA: aspartate kinase [Pseudogracilibacillus sp.]|nr:aspartate kinase [Pseudogracilibacillus sp.]
MKVAKFGGSSLADADQFKKVGDIVKADTDRKFIVVSAPGKRHDLDYKMTDLLINLAEAYINNDKYKSYYITIMDRFTKIIEELGVPTTILTEIEELIQSILKDDLSNEAVIDSFKAVGEDSSAKILSAYLQTLGIQASYKNPKDAGIILKNDPLGAQLEENSYEKIYQLRNEEGILVIPGFFGFTKEGHLTTFSRGGSDITGAIISAGVKAELYENFTDVDAVYSVNPSIISNPKEIDILTYQEMRELSYAGFSVFHDEALYPAFKEKIPVCIKNTNNPSADGTMIVANREPDTYNDNCVVGIAGDAGFKSIYVSKFLMNREIGFGRKLFEILEDEGVSFEHAPSGIDDMSIIVRDEQLPADKEQIVIDRIYNELKADTVSISRNLALVMVVGEGMKESIGMAQTATNALGDAKVNLEMINQGSSEVSMMFGIKSNGIHRAIKSLYRAFFE